MSKDTLNKLWAGRVFGTNTGKLYLELSQLSEKNISGILRFMDDNFGLVVYELSGDYEEKQIKLIGNATKVLDGVTAGILTIEGKILSDGNMKGRWTTTIGTSGTFEAFPHDVINLTSVPEEIHSKQITLGSVNLYRNDIEQLFDQIKHDFLTGRVVVTYSSNGTNKTQYLEDFLKTSKNLQKLSYLKINIQEPEAHGINRVVVVEFRNYGLSEIRVEGIGETWVIGQAEKLANFLKQFENTPITHYKKSGLSFDRIVFLILLVIIPSIPSLGTRILFVFGSLLFVEAIKRFDLKYIPNASINMTEREPSFLSRNLPSILSKAISGIAIAILTYLFHKLTELILFFQSLF